MIQVLVGHNSPETAHITPDYPYSFHLRCTRREWLEFKPKHGYRLVTQTTNPRKSHLGVYWNTPKASTYALLAVMYLDENSHVQWATLNAYANLATIEAFALRYAPALLGAREQHILAALRAWASAAAAQQWTIKEGGFVRVV